VTATIVHAGFHKTGTTTIQDFLAENREWLAAQDVHYPVDIGSPRTAHNRMACWLFSPRPFSGPNDFFTPTSRTPFVVAAA
jgi:hypothetical protein